MTDVLVVGAGSIGRRHVTNLMNAGARVTSTDVDLDRAAAAGAHAAVPFGPDVFEGHAGIVIATPTRLHLDHLEAAVATGAHVMVEKPLADRADDPDGRLVRLVEAAGPRLMVGYNLRLHRPVERLVDLVQSGAVGRPLSFRVWFGSWLPDWRPGTDYRTTYSARADLGGGVLNDAIHELDLAVWLAGTDLQVVGAVVARLGPLEIDVEDTVRALLRTPTGVPVEVELDYLSRAYRRGIEVVGDLGTVRLDWARAVLELDVADEPPVVEPADTPVAESYEREAVVFLGLVEGRARPPVGGADGLASLRLSDAIRRAAT